MLISGGTHSLQMPNKVTFVPRSNRIPNLCSSFIRAADVPQMKNGWNQCLCEASVHVRVRGGRMPEGILCSTLTSCGSFKPRVQGQPERDRSA